jgi:hypothetical protein
MLIVVMLIVRMQSSSVRNAWEKKRRCALRSSKRDSGVAVKAARRWARGAERCLLDDLGLDNTNPVPVTREHEKRCSGGVLGDSMRAVTRSVCATMAHAALRVARLGAAFSRRRGLS